MPLEENCLKDDTHTKEPLRASDRPARASLPPSLRAGMSLEAAIAVPLFLFFVMNLLFVFDSIRLQSGLQAALQQAQVEAALEREQTPEWPTKYAEVRFG